jgi:AAA domain/Primase C terminal 1 (PriCT-1)
MRDERPDGLLEECGRVGRRLGLRFSWTDSLEGAGAKACSRGGPAHWQRPKPLPADEEAAAAYTRTRARKRNPVVPAVANNLVIAEVDLNVPDDAYPPLDEVKTRVAALLRRLGLKFPKTVIVRSRRGLHFLGRPPEGKPPAKVQLTEEDDAVSWSSDGYVVGVPGLHELEGVVYEYVRVGEIATFPIETYARLSELAEETRARTQRRIATGEPIPKGERTDTIKQHVLRLLAGGAPRGRALAEAFELNEHCQPPLDQKKVEKTVDGLIRWAALHPTEAEQATAEARRILRERRVGVVELRPAQTGKRKRALQRRPISTVKAEPVEWLIPKSVPVGAPTMVAGVGGLGKSGLLLAWAKQTTDAGVDALIVSYEDAAAQVIRPRAEALGVALDRLHLLYVDALAGEISFPDDLPELDRHVRETRARLILIDPVSASIDLKLDAHKDQDVRVVLGQLARLAERERLAVVWNAHLNKAPSADVYLRVNGSTAFYNAARSVLTVTRDPAEPDWQRLVAHHKSNYGPLGDVERWQVVPVVVATEVGPMEVMTMQFVEVAEDVNREDVLATASAEEKLDRALAFLEEALSDEDWHDSAGLKMLAAARRITGRTLQRAALELDVEHERRGFPSSTWWRLPQSRQPLSPESGATGQDRVVERDQFSRAKSGEVGRGATVCTHRRRWLARDGAWRCSNCEPPAFPGEVLEEREA